MRVTDLKTNRMVNPLGFDLGRPRLSYLVVDTAAKKQEAAQIQVALDVKFQETVYDSGKSADIDSLGFELPLELQPRTRYFWRVTVWAEGGETAASEPAWFETAKMDEPWAGKWIVPGYEDRIHPVLSRTFEVDKPVKSARAYACGVGLYEMYLNGRKCGGEYLAPGFNAYDHWLQYQTYDLTDVLNEGENTVEVLLGNGMYKGRFGFRDQGNVNVYGDQFALLCEIIIDFTDGTQLVVKSDQSWNARKSKILDSSIYDGEIYDATFEDPAVHKVREVDLGYDRLKARLSLPIAIKERLPVAEVITTPSGQTILDLGQNMVGWLEFRTKAPKGTEIKLQYGEILQNGEFFRDNLRTAKAEFTYIAGGSEATVRPHFTYYGFRYVKVSGWPGELNPDDFTGCVLYSDMELTGRIETGNPLVNRLFLNALWGQKGNFLDVPTDCPQRDERLGWTGDAQVFAGTASFNMDTYAFFNKYLYDLWQEQKSRGGMVSHYVPAAGSEEGGACAWADAATIIPWNIYVQYGDRAILEQQFPSMKAWVDYIRGEDEKAGGKRLWTTGFHFGDWLALDGEDPKRPFGGTEEAYIASAFYCYSAGLVAKAARVLGYADLAEEYQTLADEVREAIRREYFTAGGRLALDNQTAYVLALFMDLAPEGQRERVIEDLRKRLAKDGFYLKTGFVGTPYLCRVLSDNGCNDIAYRLLLNEGFPSWLYAVKMGATTIWERWNSVLPDGSISDTGMNSLNHYAYGSIMEWVYRNAAGLNPLEEEPGFRKVLLRPMPDARLGYVKMSYKSPVGLYESKWEIDEAGGLKFRFVIPFNASAKAVLPHARLEELNVNGKRFSQAGLEGVQEGDCAAVELTSGTWEFSYMPAEAYRKVYSTESTLAELMVDSRAWETVREHIPQVEYIPPSMYSQVASVPLREVLEGSYVLRVGEDALATLDKALKQLG